MLIHVHVNVINAYTHNNKKETHNSFPFSFLFFDFISWGGGGK